MNAPLLYTVDFSDAAQHLFKIELKIPSHQSPSLTLSLPSWLPGSYMIRDFAKRIVTIVADDQCEITATDKQTWQLMTQGKACTVTYQVYALDHSVRTAFLDLRRAFFNGSSLFLSVNQLNDSPHHVTLIEPKFSTGWQVATGLPRAAGTAKYQFGEYIADDYHHLIDCPFELGDFDHVEFDIAGCRHHIILSGKHYGDLKRLTRDVTALCQHHIDLFTIGDNKEPPFQDYWFLLNILPSGFGGLEHKNSTALLCSTFDFANINQPKELSSGYKTLLSLISHEYFHAWNVCRIKPREFVPYQLAVESYTKQLWAYEGITSYYDDFSLYRTGLISFDDYLALLSTTISRVNRGQGQLKQSVIESSFYTWTKFYQQGEDAINNIVSYYTKGSLIALWLDLTLRINTNNRYSLDDVMRQLWQHFGQTNTGTELDDIIKIATALIGYDLTPSFDQLLNDKQPVELASLWQAVGIESQQVASQVAAPLKISTDHHQPYLGMTIAAAPTGVNVVNVSENSPAERAGISAKDQIIAIDNLVVSQSNFSQLVANLTLSQENEVALIRHGELLRVTLIPLASPTELTKLTVVTPDLLKIWQQINN